MRNTLVPPGWRRCKVGDEFEIQLGKMLTPAAASGPEQRHYLANRNVQWDQVVVDDLRRMTFSAREREYYALRSGDILVCEGGEVGRTAIWNDEVSDCYFQNAIHRLRPLRGRVLPRFFLHLMRFLSERGDLRRLTGQTSIGHLPKDKLAVLAFNCPSLSEQSRIAEVLDTVDDVTRSAVQIITKLGNVETGLVRQLILGTHRYHVVSPPSERVPLGMLADIARGKFTHRPRNDPRFYGGPYPFVQTGDIARNRGRLVFDASQTLNDLGLGVSKEFPAGTVAVTIAANIADTAILGIPMCFPDSVVGVQVKPPYNARYVELCIRLAKPRLEARAPQSAQRNINLQDLRPLQIQFRKPAEQNRIATVYEAYVSRLESERRRMEKLRALKWGLMEDLLTGRAQVKDAEELVEGGL